MVMPADTFTTYDAKGNREDLEDKIYRVSMTETPFTSMVTKGKASAVNHEWQTQNLAPVDTNNAQLEGDDAVTDPATPTVRLGNICQISKKVPRVSGTQQAVDHAGRDNEMDYQRVLKGLELKRDLEGILTGTNQAKVTGSTVLARKTASILSWLKTNNSSGAGGSPPATADGLATRTDGTQRPFTEPLLKPVLKSIWTEGGEADTILVGGANKQAMSLFTGRSQPTENATSKKIVATVDVYESDFGVLKILPSAFMRSRDALILDMSFWAIDYLRNMKTDDLAKTGDSERKQVICEYCLVSRNEKSSGIVADLTDV